MDNNETMNPIEQKSEKSTNYFKVMLLFCVVMAGVIAGLYYLVNFLF